MFTLTQNQENAKQLKVCIKSRIRLLRFYLMQKYAQIYIQKPSQLSYVKIKIPKCSLKGTV